MFWYLSEFAKIKKQKHNKRKNLFVIRHTHMWLCLKYKRDQQFIEYRLYNDTYYLIGIFDTIPEIYFLFYFTCPT
jgi:hypothetical protein